jgi:flagellar FliL protein
LPICLNNRLADSGLCGAEKNDGINPMALTENTAQANSPKGSKLPLLIGIATAILGGAGGFYLVYSGAIALGESSAAPAAISVEALPDIGFVPLDPVVISLGPASGNRHLRFVAQLEVEKAYVADLQSLRPRVVDVLNSYLRALETRDLEDPAALMRIRAQMLRRIQIVAGEGRVRDLLIMEFVLS